MSTTSIGTANSAMNQSFTALNDKILNLNKYVETVNLSVECANILQFRMSTAFDSFTVAPTTT